jgi:DNA replication and repair protein RecF
VLLREGRGDRAWIGALEETIAELGVAIVAARRDVVSRVSAAMADGGEVHPGARLAVQGDVERWLEGQPALAAESNFREALERGRDQDALTGGAATGAHRSDLAVWQTARDMPAHQCSTGEQKAILIAIVLADVRLLATTTGQAPVVLLDEVAAHLDEDRRDVLFDLVLGLGAQIWATGTDVKMFRGLEDRAQFLKVVAGKIT